MRKLLVTGDFEIPKDVLPDNVELHHIRCPKDEQQIMEILPGIHDYILGGPEYMSAPLIDVASSLENIVVMGTGIPSFVDVEHATNKGIRLTNTPYMNVRAVAEFTLAMITVSLSNIFESIEGVKKGTHWTQTPRRTLSSLNIGIVGMGAIGSEMARQLHLQECTNLYYWSRTRKLELEKNLNLKYSSLINLVGDVDILCIHLSGGSKTRSLIDKFVLARANPKLMIFNMSNPRIICPSALKTHLQYNLESLCFIDGYYNEWAENKGQYNDPYDLLCLPNLIATSHLAGQEQQTIDSIFSCAMRQVIRLTSSIHTA
ncbi:2-hydroxyacid dehydrogenase [Pseudomonas sp. NFX98]|uniref:2-hydroxyacid dehydrogenase n=1 Tax=Pseudomonas sp. NFX98 TaxID=3399122 RepID=UPI0039FD5582